MLLEKIHKYGKMQLWRAVILFGWVENVRNSVSCAAVTDFCCRD